MGILALGPHPLTLGAPSARPTKISPEFGLVHNNEAVMGEMDYGICGRGQVLPP